MPKSEEDLLSWLGVAELVDPPLREVYWIGPVPAHSDVSKQPIEEAFIDGYDQRVKCWSIMTITEHAQYGFGLGQGRGQLYRKQVDGRFLKTQG